MKLLGWCLAIAAACGGSQPTSPAAPAKTPAEAPHELPEYPGGVMAGVTGGGDPTVLTIATDPIDMVRAFYTKQPLKGFEILGGDATKGSPLKVRDTVSHREYAIAIYEQDGVTMIAATTHAF
ncbi:MAG: hypothetical protein ABJE66_01945 [Deltaproteobacteria bacterium]